MAWQFTKRDQEALCVGRQQAYYPPPWKRWLSVSACAAATVLLGLGSAKAQTGSAPFVFEGDVLRIEAPEWTSSHDHLVAEPAYIDVVQDVKAHIGGDIKPVPGSPNGLYKLGGGTLRLSGTNTYRGSTRLWQGSLHIDGPAVFGAFGGIETVKGTQLEYSPGINISRPLTVRDAAVDDMPPVVPYTPVAAPAGMDDVLRWRVGAGAATHSGLLQGNGAFVKLGEGLLDITGDAMAYTGQARVAEGALAVNEIFSGSVLVHNGARLQGVGEVGAVHIQAGGVLAPGNYVSPVSDTDGGALTIKGNALFEPGSRFQVVAWPTGEATTVQVGGTALLGGEVAVLAQNGLWKTSSSYDILQAGGGLGGTQFASVASDLAFLTPALSYSADTVTLTLERNDVPLDDAGETPDEKDVGKVIDEDTPGGKANPDLHDKVAGLDKDSAGWALGQLSGNWNASVLSSVWEDSRFVREAVLRRAMASPGHGPVRRRVMAVPSVFVSGTTPPGRAGAAAPHAKPASDPSFTGLGALRPWAELFHSDGNRRESNAVPGDTRRIDGLVLGAGLVATAYWEVGAVFGVQRSRLRRSQAAAGAEIETVHMGAHWAAQIPGLSLAVGAVHSLHRLSTHRQVLTGALRDALKARHRGQTTQVFGEVAWPLYEISLDAQAPTSTVTPSSTSGSTASSGPAVSPTAITTATAMRSASPSPTSTSTTGSG
ncbi:MAG TPA: autotransporter domain-containing protein, partial [Pusillimonas sp.]|uniref:autotransporter outer membrane beta-barrel domain-containing protein n=1 Tax=Pusillimonas sp. TaxID=3040095 RepID=UPI002D1C8C48